MLKLEQQVCSLELAQKLKSLGAKQESLFYRVKTLAADGWFYRMWNEKMLDEVECVSAFTVAELGEMLPPLAEGYKSVDGRWVYTQEELHGLIFKDTEADARAKMLIYLLENKLLTL